ncbi:ExbD/TolR family protein [Methyloversatilis sp.]|uniref:ExbD/TolR family protein n=1 Tax=Methyloversatilis sp. TaxID=2569862 RepID=UPI0035AF8BA4
MRMRSEHKLYDDVNLTPLMDLAWNLLIVFIIMATATVQGITVDLPRASAAPSMSKPKTKAVTVTADGRIYLDTALVSIGELEMRLRQYKAADPDLPVVVKGDASIQYYKVIEVLDVMKRLQITQLGLVTDRLVK